MITERLITGKSGYWFMVTTWYGRIPVFAVSRTKAKAALWSRLRELGITGPMKYTDMRVHRATLDEMFFCDPFVAYGLDEAVAAGRAKLTKRGHVVANTNGEATP